MEHQPKTEPGLGSTDQTNLEAMTIQELVSVLRTAFLTEDFDRVEDVLVSRYNKLQTENLHLQEKFELEKLMRFQAEEDLMKREELCEKGKKAQNNYETLLKEVKKSSLVDTNIIGELRKKNDELELEVCELRKLKKRWMDDSSALSELIHKRSKDAQGASSSSVTTQTREATIDAAHSGHGYSTTSLCRESAAKHAPIVENDNLHVLEEVIVTDSVVVPPSDMQEQMVTQNKAKRKRFATNASSNSFDNFHFISLVHQERYSKFMANRKFVPERNIRLEGDKFSDIQAMIVARGWVELTSFAKEASTTLAKEFFANAYQGPSKEDGNDKNDLMQFTSFVRGKMVPFHDEIINQLFGLENYEQCSFEARKAKGSKIDHQEIHSTLCKPEADWVRKKDGSPLKLRTIDLTPNAKAWATFVLHTLLPCSNVSDLPIQKATLLTAIIKGEPVNVGRLLADDLWSTANCSSPTSYINHASLISKLCERVGVYPEKNEEMMMPYGSITAKWIEKNSTASSKISVHPHK
ncbi:uncharacterized protein LOC123882145 [Trifolium pratense]|uniref:uncharacterized protein LOC123882145 n=1 Tax=Trifolium pratense TaxID=57577 RepID=UPI001E69261F|nr:uncharacterized protein LOC123882145 [Trifolium pratense]